MKAEDNKAVFAEQPTEWSWYRFRMTPKQHDQIRAMAERHGVTIRALIFLALAELEMEAD